jgi:hypothetical protein
MKQKKNSSEIFILKREIIFGEYVKALRPSGPEAGWSQSRFYKALEGWIDMSFQGVNVTYDLKKFSDKIVENIGTLD